MALGISGLLAATGGCATTPPPVRKIVNGRVVVTRAITPEAYDHVARALLYEEEQRWEDAARELQRALPLDEDGAELRAHLADLFIRLDRLEDAAEQVQRSLRVGETVAGRLAAAHVAEARRDERTALIHYRAAATLALSDQDSSAIERTHLALANAQLATLDVTAAYETVRTLRDAAGDSVRARVELAAIAWPLGKFSEAEAALLEALQLEPAELDARLMMAALLVATDRAPAAKAAFREALQRSEDSVDIAEMYLRWLVARGDKSEAAQQADDLTPDLIDPGTFETIMRVERAAGRLERVKQVAGEALKKGASASRVSLLVAAAMLDAKDRAGAAAQLAGIPRTSPDFIESRLRMAEALRDAPGGTELERAGRALDEAEAAISRLTTTSKAPAVPRPGGGAPGKSPAVGSAGAGASDTAGAAAAARDWTTEISVARALWEEKRGDAVRAARTLDGTLAMLEKNPDHPGAAALPRLLLVRGAIEERRGDWRRALGFAEKILATDARHIEALNFHGFISVEHNHELPRATQRLQVAMALDPGGGGSWTASDGPTSAPETSRAPPRS